MRTCDTILSLALCALGVALPANAQHVDVLVQRQGSKLYTGIADNDEFAWSMGARVFARDFDSDYLIDTPGFSALAATSSAMPSGYSGLPASSPLSWDFLPMAINAAISNLMFWDGADTNANGIDPDDVEFVPAVGHSLSLQGSTGTASANATGQLIQGHSLGNTGSNGSLHVHRSFRLTNSEPGVLPVDGLYLAALQLRMNGQDPSDPFYLVFGTPGSSFASRHAASQWVDSRVDLLTEMSLPGDYNSDGQVDAADYTVWRDSLHQQGASLPADGSGNEIVDAADYDLWTQNFGAHTQSGFASTARQGIGSIAPSAAATVPEPTTSASLGITVVVAVFIRRRD